MSKSEIMVGRERTGIEEGSANFEGAHIRNAAFMHNFVCDILTFVICLILIELYAVRKNVAGEYVDVIFPVFRAASSAVSFCA